MTENIFIRNLAGHIETAEKTAALSEVVTRSARMMSDALRNGGRVFFCGNGGSAADAQHLAAELSGRYLKERRPLDGVALHCNTSALTAIANDYGAEEIFARQILAHGRKGDVLVAISTSGDSVNLLKAVDTAASVGIRTIGMTGESGGAMGTVVDELIAVPSAFTPRIQEIHILIGHILCEIIESEEY